MEGTEQVGCLLCGNAGDKWVEQNGWTARRCNDCRLVFLSPRPTDEAVAAIYQDGAAHNSADRHLQSHSSWVTKREARFALNTLRRHRKPGASVLEIGPGSGAFLSEAKAAGYSVAGIELNPDQAAFIRSQGIECAETLNALEELGPADVIYHKDVLSHFPDPEAAFTAFHDALNPGGMMVFETGNGDYDTKYVALHKSLQFPDHLQFFGEKALDMLLEQTGFRTVARLRFGTVLQMRIDQAIRRKAGDTSTGKQSVVARGRAWEMLSFMRFVVRYRIGRVMPKRNRPYTMVTVAVRR